LADLAWAFPTKQLKVAVPATEPDQLPAGQSSCTASQSRAEELFAPQTHFNNLILQFSQL